MSKPIPPSNFIRNINPNNDFHQKRLNQNPPFDLKQKGVQQYQFIQQVPINRGILPMQGPISPYHKQENHRSMKTIFFPAQQQVQPKTKEAQFPSQKALRPLDLNHQKVHPQIVSLWRQVQCLRKENIMLKQVIYSKTDSQQLEMLREVLKQKDKQIQYLRRRKHQLKKQLQQKRSITPQQIKQSQQKKHKQRSSFSINNSQSHLQRLQDTQKLPKSSLNSQNQQQSKKNNINNTHISNGNQRVRIHFDQKNSDKKEDRKNQQGWQKGQRKYQDHRQLNRSQGKDLSAEKREYSQKEIWQIRQRVQKQRQMQVISQYMVVQGLKKLNEKYSDQF